MFLHSCAICALASFGRFEANSGGGGEGGGSFLAESMHVLPIASLNVW